MYKHGMIRFFSTIRDWNYQYVMIVLLITLSVLPIAFFLYFAYISRQDAGLINRAGAQRMLSQRIALLMVQRIEYDDRLPSHTSENVNRLIDLFQSSHEFLISDRVPVAMSSLNVTEKDSADDLVRKYIDQARLTLKTGDRSALKILLKDESILLNKLNSVVFDYQDFVDQRRMTVALLFLSLLIGEILLIILMNIQQLRSNRSLAISRKQLKSSEDLYQATVSHMFDALVVINRSGTIRFVNDATKNIFGYSDNELEGQNVSILTPDSVRNKHDNYIHHYLETGEAHIIGSGREVMGKRKDGSSIVLDLSISEGEYNDDKIFIGVLRDITKRKALEQEMDRMRQVHEQGENLAHLGSWEWDIKDNKVRWSDEIYKIMGIPPGSIAPAYKEYLHRTHPDDMEIAKEMMIRAYRNRSSFMLEHRIILPDQSIRFIQSQGKVILNEENKASVIIGTLQDITEIVITKEQLYLANETLNRYVNIVNENVITSTTNLKGIITDVSNAFCHISGYSREELMGKPHKIVRHPDMSHQFYEELWNTIKQDKIWKGEIKNRRKDGSSYWVDVVITPVFDRSGNKTGYTAIRQDITDKKQIEVMSITDELTRIHNRRHFNFIFQEMLQRSARAKEIFVLTIIDVDHFKKYNDTYGHAAGDEVLKSIAGVFIEFMKRSADDSFRLGGEEFGLIFSTTSEQNVIDFLEEIRAAIENLQIEHRGNPPIGFVTASFGAIRVDYRRDPMVRTNQDELYHRADEALYRAKEEGRNRCVLVAYE